MTTVYLSLGSNLGNRRLNLEAAVTEIAAPEIQITRISSLYETAPMYVMEQPWFLNLVAEAETDFSAADLFRYLADVETSLGREREIVNGPRIIDIDILLFGAAVIQSAELKIPHPRMVERRFVLEPLAELAPDLAHPITGILVSELLRRVSQQAVRKLP